MLQDPYFPWELNLRGGKKAAVAIAPLESFILAPSPIYNSPDSLVSPQKLLDWVG
jgi:hypothetical protein